MKRTYLYIILFLLSSCSKFGNQVPSEKELLRKELDTIDWNDVDEFPMFEICEENKTKELLKQCFFETMSRIIQEKISGESLTLKTSGVYDVKVLIRVNADQSLDFKPQFPKTLKPEDTLAIDNLLKSRLVDFPNISPALKRGIPVTMEYVLPIVLASN